MGIIKKGMDCPLPQSSYSHTGQINKTRNLSSVEVTKALEWRDSRGFLRRDLDRVREK